MPSEILFDADGHKNLLFEQFGSGGLAVEANQHLIIHGKEAMLLDPGGHKVYNKVMAQTFKELAGKAKLKTLFLSHQDPDICAAINGWLMTTSADAYVSRLWVRFVAHFGLDKYVGDRLKEIPDEGMKFELGGVELHALPAHFLHSAGNFHLYDPTSKILYTGDLGASLGEDYREVTDFEAHRQYMDGFHRRYMNSTRAMTAWAAMARQLDIEMICPQHGALFRGKELVDRFIDWADGFECGIDTMLDVYRPLA